MEYIEAQVLPLVRSARIGTTKLYHGILHATNAIAARFEDCCSSRDGLQAQ